MNPELYFLVFCVAVLVLFTLSLVFNVMISGSKFMKTYQFLMGTLSYSKEVDSIISRLLDKTDAELLVAKLNDNTIQFFPVDSTESDEDTPYSRTLKAEAEIFIGSKYYSYGYIHRHFGEAKSSEYKKRPSISTFRKILKLEEKLRGEKSTNKAPEVTKNKGSVELQ